jgi:hypothetical protein
MAINEGSTPEVRSAQVNVRLTPSEKADVILVAAFDASNESETLRNYSVAQIRERAAEIRSMRPSGEAAA